MIFSDLQLIKKLLQIDLDDHAEDFTLSYFDVIASDLIEEIMGRSFTLKERTQFYKGTGTQKLLLRNRPVFTSPTIRVFQDEGANFGSSSGAFDPEDTELVYGEDFCLQIDQDDMSSRSAILLRINDYWPRPTVRQGGLLAPFIGEDKGSIKVIYTAGFTVETLPPHFRAGAELLITRLRYLFPLGMAIAGEGYEERSISLNESQKLWLTGLVRPFVIGWRNWRF